MKNLISDALHEEYLEDFMESAASFLKVCRLCNCADRQKKIGIGCRLFCHSIQEWREIFGFGWPERSGTSGLPLENQILFDAAWEFHTLPSPSSWGNLIQAADRYREAGSFS